MGRPTRTIEEGVLSDWERLKKQENNISAVFVHGRDLLREMERVREDRDGWQKIAMEAQGERNAAQAALKQAMHELEDLRAKASKGE